MSKCRRGFGLDTGFIDHLRIVNTGNCRSLTGLHTPKVTVTTAHSTCSLQFLLASPAQSFSGPTPSGLATTFYYLKFETPPSCRARSPYLNPPGTWWPGYTPRQWISFSLLPTTRRATVEVFDPAFTRD
jgi:hypothetical protein